MDRKFLVRGLPKDTSRSELEAIWRENQDERWRKTQRQLCDLALKHGMILGCPDFVNTGPKWVERANTCCGIDVPNPSTFNTHHWKYLLQKGVLGPKGIVTQTYEGIGDKNEGIAIIKGTHSKNYTMKDAGVL